MLQKITANPPKGFFHNITSCIILIIFWNYIVLTLGNTITSNAATVILFLSLDVRCSIQICLEKNPSWEGSPSAVFLCMPWNTCGNREEQEKKNITILIL